jgi:hypothetical protein
VQWELRRDKEKTPRWYEAAQAAKKIMRRTDNGFRYWKRENVQPTGARISNANMLALIDIMASNVTRLDLKNFEPHPWLLAGTEAETTRIYGGTGLSPKLLHTFGQITHLCGLMDQDEKSMMFPLAAKRLDDKLVNFRQWSELSPIPEQRHASAEALLQSCQLDQDGLVTTKSEVTDLGAEAWVQAARIYLQFRFFRLVNPVCGNEVCKLQSFYLASFCLS